MIAAQDLHTEFQFPQYALNHTHLLQFNLVCDCLFMFILPTCLQLKLFVLHRDAESQLSSDTDLEDPDGRNARAGRGMVCFLFFYSCL